MKAKKEILSVFFVAVFSVSALQAQETVKRDVPYVPTSEEVVQAMLNLARVSKNDMVYDLGCGDGRIVVTAAKKFGVNDPVYEGMIVGVHNRDNDLVVNATRTKQLTNFRVSGKEDAVKVTPPIELTLEYGVEFIEDDELVEITPKSIRLRKRYLKEHERKRALREAA